MFDGSPEKLAFFLNQVWSHLDRYRNNYSDEAARVDIIMANLKAEVAEWMTTLHNEDAPKLVTPDALLGSLQTCFGDPAQNQWVEIEVRRLRQGTRPVIEYIREFRRFTVRLRHWPEQLLTQFFWEGLSHDLLQLCLAGGISNQLDDWYQLVAALEVDLMLCKYRERAGPHPKKTQER